MKRAAVLAAVITCLVFPLGALGYTVYVGVDDSLQLSSIDGFLFDVSAAVSGPTFPTYDVNESVSVNGVTKPGAVPLSGGWEIGQLSNSRISAVTLFPSLPLSQGIILSLEGASQFSLISNSLILYDYSKEGFLYSGAFGVTGNLFDGGAEYTITSAPVPIPPTLLLLGAGLAGLAAMRWRKGA